MIAEWIAQALLKGQDHLILTTAELAKWQRHGCRVSFYAPWYSFGAQAVFQLGKLGQKLEQELVNTPPTEWPVGDFYAGERGNGRKVWMPHLEFESDGSGNWRVPLIPSDPNHSLNSWDFDLNLKTAELDALKPIANQLVKRMLLRCEIKAAHKTFDKTVLWNEGRLALVEVSDIEFSLFEWWFSRCAPYSNSRPMNLEMFSDDFQNKLRVKGASGLGPQTISILEPPRAAMVQQERLVATSTLTQSDNYNQTLTLLPVAALRNSFEMLIQSQLLSAKDPSALHDLHRVIVTDSALKDLRHAIDQCLSWPHPPSWPDSRGGRGRLDSISQEAIGLRDRWIKYETRT